MSRLLLRRGPLVRRRGAGGGSAPVVGATDGFDGTGSDLGPGWSVFRGQGARVGGQATSPTVEDILLARKDFSVGSSNMATEVDWVVGDPGADRSVGVWARVSSTAANGYVFEVNDRYDRYSVFRVIDGAHTNVSGGFQQLPGVDTPGRMRVEVRDDDAGHPVITCYWKGERVGQFTDVDPKAIKTGSMGGLQVWNGGGVIRLDGFGVEALTAGSGGGTTPPAATAFFDGFDGSGPGLAASWRDVVGTGYRENGRIGSSARISDPSGAPNTWLAVNDFVSPTDRQFTQITYAVGSTDDRSCGVLVRALPGQNRGYMLEANDAANRVSLLRIEENGIGTGLTGFVPISAGVTPPGVLRLEVETNTSGAVVLHYYWAGVKVGTYTDSSSKRWLDGRCGGFSLYNPFNVTRADDFSTGSW